MTREKFDKVVSGFSDEAMRRLRLFSRSANRVVPHAFDRRRFCDLVIVAHYEGAQIDADDLAAWLREDGWPPEYASDLASRYEFGMELLAHLEKKA